MTDTQTTSAFNPGEKVAVIGNTANKSQFAGWIGRVNHCRNGKMGPMVSVDFDHSVYGKHEDVLLFPAELEKVERVVHHEGVVEILEGYGTVDFTGSSQSDAEVAAEIERLVHHDGVVEILECPLHDRFSECCGAAVARNTKAASLGFCPDCKERCHFVGAEPPPSRSWLDRPDPISEMELAGNPK